jgi:glycosyltransferase involved in cell wall biosynthesis
VRLCYVADARSPIARNWISHFVEAGHEVHLISSYPADPGIIGMSSQHTVPLAFSDLIPMRRRKVEQQSERRTGLRGSLGSAAIGRLGLLRDGLGVLDLARHTSRIRRIIEEIRPSLVHAMRIPFEGMAAAEALRNVGIPLLISIWGNDFTLHARRNRLVATFTRRALARADAIQPDATRDLRLARELGFAARKPSIVLPSGGGVQVDVFRPGPVSPALHRQLSTPAGAPVIFNPRGFREYVFNDTFFRAIPLVLERRPETVFVCASMAGSRIARQWVEKLRIARAVRLLPQLNAPQMADLFRLAHASVSLTEHDGTPNSLLEAMACGSLPIVGDVESVRSWVVDGVNGLVCDPRREESVARVIIRSLEQPELRQHAARRNRQIVIERAEHRSVMADAATFYQHLIGMNGDHGRPELQGAAS